MVENSWQISQAIQDKIRGTNPSAIKPPQGPMQPNNIPLNLDQAAKFDQSTPGQPEKSQFYNADISAFQVDTSGSPLDYHKDGTTYDKSGGYRAVSANALHGGTGAVEKDASFMGTQNTVIGQDEFGNDIISKTHANTKVVEVKETSYHTNKDNQKIWTTQDTQAQGNYPATKGGHQSFINLDVNPNLNKMENIMALQKKNLLGIDKKTQGLNTITGEKLDIASIQPAGTHKFEMWDYGAGTSRDVFYNIGKNTDKQQHQNALNKQSFGQFQNQLQSQFSTNLRSGSMDGSTLTNIIDKINASSLTDKQKTKLRKEYKKKAKNYQKAAGGYGTDTPWSFGTTSTKTPNKAETIKLKMLSGEQVSAKEMKQYSILTGTPLGSSLRKADPNFGGYQQFL